MSLALLALAAALAAPPTMEARGVAAMQRLADAWDAVQTMTYRLRKTERLRSGEVVAEGVFVKLRKPGAFYIQALEPRKGQEVIYDSRRDRQRLVVHPGRFPDFTLRLDIRGKLTTNRQHHIVSHSGLEHTISGLRQALIAARDGDDGGALVWKGEGALRGHPTHTVELVAGRAGLVPVPAREDEILFDFAERVGQDAYLIYYVNPSIDWVGDELEARDYLVPAYYSSKTELIFNADTGLPLQITFWDHKGRLYERFEFFEMQVNPKLTDLDFDPGNPAYDF